VFVYAAAAAAAFISPWLSAGLYAGLVVFYMVESTALAGREV
jgi:hypothetical protein